MSPGYNSLPDKDIYDGDQRRETEFDSAWQKALQDGAGLYAKAEEAYPGRAVTVSDALDFDERADGDSELLRRAIAHTIREKAKRLTGIEQGIVEFEGEKRFGSLQKVLTADQKEALFGAFERDFAAAPRSKDIPWADIKNALEAAGEESLYGLNKMRENGHEVGVVRAEKDGEKGFRFDSCASESPSNIRDVDYFDAERIAESEWGVPLMEEKIFEELRLADIIRNKKSWDYLKTTNPGTKKKPGRAVCGDYEGIFTDYDADVSFRGGGFRCSLWVAEA